MNDIIYNVLVFLKPLGSSESISIACLGLIKEELTQGATCQHSMLMA